MTSYAERIKLAASFINAAKEEETPTGNALLAARNYITAMEIIATVADEVPIHDANSRRFFLNQLRQRMEQYYERAELLLSVANEMGLVDKPTKEGGLQAATNFLPDFSSPQRTPLFTSREGTPNRTPHSNTVMGIPVASQENPPAGDWAGGEEPPLQYYFSQPPAEPTPPPATQGFTSDELDNLFRACSFDKPQQ